MYRANRPWKLTTYLLLTLWALFSLGPLYWLLSTAFKPRDEAMSFPPTLFPQTWTLANFRDLLAYPGFGTRPFVNSFVIAMGTVLLSVSIGLLAGYAFARFRFPGRRSLLIFILFIQMIPLLALIIPLYKVYATLHLLNSLYGLILADSMLAVPLVTWLMMGYFETIPAELEEAAMVDGCTRWGALWRISLPLAAPGIAAGAIYAFTKAWDEFLFALTFVSTAPELKPYTLALYRFIADEGTVSWHQIAAAAFISVVPVLIMFTLFQKYFIAGLTGGALKG